MFRKINLSSTQIDWLLLALVLLAAAFLRFYRLVDFPPGLPSDVAVNGDDAWRLLHQRGMQTLYLPGNGGRESLFIYLQAVAVAALGTVPLALRLPAALVDCLTVGLGFGFVRLLFHADDSSLRRWAAFWAGLALAAGSPWLVSLSRLGFRAVLVPCVSVALFGAFLLAWRRESRRWFIIAGVLLGLTGYTYFAAKILPVVLAAAVLPEIWRGGLSSAHRQRRTGLLWMLVAAVLVYLPMQITLALRPPLVNDRMTTVALWGFANSPRHFLALLWESVINSAGFFCCRGNPKLLQFGPDEPALRMAMGAFLLVGLVWALKHAAAIEWRLVAAWFLLGLLPGVLAVESPHPLRLIAAGTPAVLLLVTGMVLPLRYQIRGRQWQVTFFTFWLVVTAFFTFNSYFKHWPEQADLRQLFRTDLLELAQTVTEQAEAGTAVYLPRSLYANIALRYYLAGKFPPEAPTVQPAETAKQVVWLDEPGESSWVRLGDGRAVVLPPLSQSALAGLGQTQKTITLTGSTLNWQEPQMALNAVVAPFKLIGATFPAVIPPGGTLEVTLWWEAVTQPPWDYRFLVQLLDEKGQVWSLDGPINPAAGAYPAPFWRPGLDQVPDQHTLHLKDGLPPGRYRLAVAVLDSISLKRLPVSAPTGDSPDTVFLGPLKSPLPPADESGFSRMSPVRFAGVADLIGYRLTPGQPAGVELLWRAAGPAAVDYTVFVHLLNPAGELVGGHDAQPVNGAYPTGIWSAGETIIDPHAIDTGAVAPGRYRLEVGLYNLATGERVSADGSTLLPAELDVAGP